MVAGPGTTNLLLARSTSLLGSLRQGTARRALMLFLRFSQSFLLCILDDTSNQNVRNLNESPYRQAWLS